MVWIGLTEMLEVQAMVAFATKPVNGNSGRTQLSIKQGMELRATFSLFKGMIACNTHVQLEPLLIDLELEFKSDEVTKVLLDFAIEITTENGQAW